MDWNRSLCIIVYSIVLVQCTVTMTFTYIKIKRSDAFYMLMVNEVIVSLWLILGMNEVQASSQEELLIFVRFSLFPIVMCSATWLIFALVYAKIISLKNKKIIALIIAPKLLLYLPAFGNKYFHLIIIEKTYEHPADTIWGIFTQLNFTLGYIYIMAGIVIILAKAIHDYKILKKRIVFVILGPFITLVTNIGLRIGILPQAGFDYTPVTFSLFAMFLSLAIFRYKAFGVIQNAAMDVFKDNEEAILILDKDYSIAEYNGAALDEFSAMVQLETCHSIYSFIDQLKQYNRNVSKLNKIIESIEIHQELIDHYFIVESPGGRRYYSMILRYVKDQEGSVQGAVMKIANRTIHSMGMLKEERNRISGDIHDNLSNMINVVSMNLDYSIKHYENRENVIRCMGVAYEASKQIRLHLRRILDELTPVNIKEVGLINAIKSLFKRLEGIGVSIDFKWDLIDDYINYDEEYGMIIYKTCMEGINNAFFNGRANAIQVELTCFNEWVHLKMKDNGIGCDHIVKGRGLTTMERRLESVEGRVSFWSEDGEGFVIEAEFPLRYDILSKEATS